MQIHPSIVRSGAEHISQLHSCELFNCFIAIAIYEKNFNQLLSHGYLGCMSRKGKFDTAIPRAMAASGKCALICKFPLIESVKSLPRFHINFTDLLRSKTQGYYVELSSMKAPLNAFSDLQRLRSVQTG